MKYISTWLIVILLAAPAIVLGQQETEDEAIRETALDYIQGWYTGDADRMVRALHPDLAKRIVGLEGENLLHLAKVDGRWVIINVLWALRPESALNRTRAQE